MWRDDVQRGAVAQALLAAADLDYLWGTQGPSEEARNYDDGQFSASERVMLRLALSVWNGSGYVSLDDLMSSLSHALLKVVAEFLAAYADGEGAIDRWLKDRGGE